MPSVEVCQVWKCRRCDGESLSVGAGEAGGDASFGKWGRLVGRAQLDLQKPFHISRRRHPNLKSFVYQ